LSGPGLPNSVWYLDDLAAVSYAHWKGKGKGGKVHRLDSREYCILTESIEGERQVSQYGSQVGQFQPAS
jgi:hypothetical protein